MSQGYNQINIFKNWGNLLCWMSVKERKNMKQCANANVEYAYAKVAQWRNKWESCSWCITVLWVVRNVWIQRTDLQAFKVQLYMDWMVTQSKQLLFCDDRDQKTSLFRHYLKGVCRRRRMWHFHHVFLNFTSTSGDALAWELCFMANPSSKKVLQVLQWNWKQARATTTQLYW